jgi:hypothetical protein
MTTRTLARLASIRQPDRKPAHPGIIVGPFTEGPGLISAVIEMLLADGPREEGKQYQIFLLSGPEDPTRSTWPNRSRMTPSPSRAGPLRGRWGSATSASRT